MASIMTLNNQLLSTYPSLKDVTFLLREIDTLNKLMEEYLMKSGDTFITFLERKSLYEPQYKSILAKLKHFIPFP